MASESLMLIPRASTYICWIPDGCKLEREMSGNATGLCGFDDYEGEAGVSGRWLGFVERSSSNSGLVAKRSGKCSSYSDKRGQIRRLCGSEKPYSVISFIACFGLHPSSAMR